MGKAQETATDEAPVDGMHEDELAASSADNDFGPPFIQKTFGGAFVWAKGEHFVATVLRVKEGKSVPVATKNRQDMFVMLTGGRAVLEIQDEEDPELERIELEPAAPFLVEDGSTYRLVAMTDVELFTVYSPIQG